MGEGLSPSPGGRSDRHGGVAGRGAGSGRGGGTGHRKPRRPGAARDPFSSGAGEDCAALRALAVPAPQTSRFGTGVWVGASQCRRGVEPRCALRGGDERRDVSGSPDRRRPAAGPRTTGRGGRGRNPCRFGVRPIAMRRDYLAALAGADTRLLSYPRGNQRDGRALRPSRWALDSIGAVTGSDERLYSGDLEDVRPNGAYRVEPSYVHRVAAPGPPMSLDDRDLRSLLVWHDSGHRLAEPFSLRGGPARSGRGSRIHRGTAGRVHSIQRESRAGRCPGGSGAATVLRHPSGDVCQVSTAVFLRASARGAPPPRLGASRGHRSDGVRVTGAPHSGALREAPGWTAARRGRRRPLRRGPQLMAVAGRGDEGVRGGGTGRAPGVVARRARAAQARAASLCHRGHGLADQGRQGIVTTGVEQVFGRDGVAPVAVSVPCGQPVHFPGFDRSGG